MEKKNKIEGQNIINVNVSDPNKVETKGLTKYVSVFRDTFFFISQASFKSILKFFITSTLVIGLIVGGKFFYAAANSKELMDAIVDRINHKNEIYEERGIEIRQDIVTPGIQKELKMLCYTLNADRVFLFELHNGKKSAGGLPFLYADMSYEEVNLERCLEYVAIQFQNVPLTLYKYPNYLFSNRYVYSSVEEIAEIDNAFAKNIVEMGGKYLAITYITIHGKPLGFLCASFHTEPVLSEDVIKEKITNSARILKPLLDLNSQLSIKNKQEEKL